MRLNGAFAASILCNVVPFFERSFCSSLLLFRRDSIDSFFQRYFHESGFNRHAQSHPISQHRSSSFPHLSPASLAADYDQHEAIRLGNLHRGDKSRQIVHDDHGDITNVEVAFGCQSNGVVPAALRFFAPVDASTAKLDYQPHPQPVLGGAIL